MQDEGYLSRPFGRTYDTQAEKDILDGKISISQIPFEYRYSTPYRYAFRRLRGLKQIGQDDAAERKVFKIISENSRKFNFRDENDQTYK